MDKNTLKPWDVIAARDVYVATPWIRVVIQEVRLATGRVLDDYHQIELPEGIIVFAHSDATSGPDRFGQYRQSVYGG